MVADICALRHFGGKDGVVTCPAKVSISAYTTEGSDTVLSCDQSPPPIIVSRTGRIPTSPIRFGIGYCEGVR